MKILTVRMPKKLHEMIRKLAKEKGVTMNALVITLLWERLETEQGGC